MKPAVYKGAPSFVYEIGDYTVDQQGTLAFSGESDDEALVLLAALKERGYEAGEAPEEALNHTPAGEERELEIEIPKDGFSVEALDRLMKIIASKETLIRKALGAESLPVQDRGDTLCFPWFTHTGTDGEGEAYARFVFALCNMAKKQKRVVAREQETTNDKFAMRVFLIRLGFIGPECAVARKILLRNLTGNSSWKNGPPRGKTVDAETVSEATQSEDAP